MLDIMVATATTAHGKMLSLEPNHSAIASVWTEIQTVVEENVREEFLKQEYFRVAGIHEIVLNVNGEK